MDEYKLYKERITLYPDWWVFILSPLISFLGIGLALQTFSTWNPRNDTFFTVFPVIWIALCIWTLSVLTFRVVIYENHIESNVAGFHFRKIAFSEIEQIGYEMWRQNELIAFRKKGQGLFSYSFRISFDFYHLSSKLIKIAVFRIVRKNPNIQISRMIFYKLKITPQEIEEFKKISHGSQT